MKSPDMHLKPRWIAVIVLLCLAGIVAVISLHRTYSDEGYRPSTRSQIANLGTALGAFEVDNGYYPRGANGLIYLIEKPPGATNWRGPYLEKSVPFDPWGHAYIYECPGRHNPQGYDLSAMGPDGHESGNWKQK
jgi:general secretion pathway protein G